jgi:hypothetical protein
MVEVFQSWIKNFFKMILDDVNIYIKIWDQ